MPLRNTMWIILFSTALSLAGAVSFLLFINPTDLQLWMLIIFYCLVFLTTLGIFSLLGTYVRVYLKKADVPIRQFTRSLRQAVFFSLLIVATLLLSHVGYLNMWTLLLLILGLACIELFFLTSRSRST